MVRRIYITFLGTLLLMSVSAVAYGDARQPQTGGENILQASVMPDNNLEVVKGLALPVDAGRSPMLSAAKKALTFSSRGQGNLFVTGRHSGSGSGSGSGTGTGTASNGNGNGNGTKPPQQAEIPEPYALLLFGTGLAGLAATLRRRRQ